MQIYTIQRNKDDLTVSEIESKEQIIE